MRQSDSVKKTFSIHPDALGVLESKDNMSAYVSESVRRRHIQVESAKLIIEVAQTALDCGYPEADERAFWGAAERFTAYRGGSPPEWLRDIGVGFSGPPFGGDQPRVEPGTVELPATEIERVVSNVVDGLNLGVESQEREIGEAVLDRYGFSEGPERVSSEELDGDVEMETTIREDAMIVAELENDETELENNRQ
ncbi:hypothetical protein BRD22_02550 [Halobacteriales archaeon SW_8_68_21]|nr:MAG: hypothetical protein BRD22_02550 [Halobacteriales archaeon SW_8_68_21]